MREVYNTIYDASVGHLASHGRPHNDCGPNHESNLLLERFQGETLGTLLDFSQGTGNTLIASYGWYKHRRDWGINW